MSGAKGERLRCALTASARSLPDWMYMQRGRQAAEQQRQLPSTSLSAAPRPGDMLQLHAGHLLKHLAQQVVERPPLPADGIYATRRLDLARPAAPGTVRQETMDGQQHIGHGADHAHRREVAHGISPATCRVRD